MRHLNFRSRGFVWQGPLQCAVKGVSHNYYYDSATINEVGIDNDLGFEERRVNRGGLCKTSGNKLPYNYEAEAEPFRQGSDSPNLSGSDDIWSEALLVQTIFVVPPALEHHIYLHICAMSTVSDWAHALLNPSPIGLIVAILLAISIPIFLHSIVFKASGLATLPSILLIGPSGSGKTSLLTLVSLAADIAVWLFANKLPVRAGHKRTNTHIPDPDSSRMRPASWNNRRI